MIRSGPGYDVTLRTGRAIWGGQRRLPGGFFLFIRNALGWGVFSLFLLAIGRFSVYFIIGLNSIRRFLSFSLSIAVLVSWRVGSLSLVPLMH